MAVCREKVGMNGFVGQVEHPWLIPLSILEPLPAESVEDIGDIPFLGNAFSVDIESVPIDLGDICLLYTSDAADEYQRVEI